MSPQSFQWPAKRGSLHGPTRDIHHQRAGEPCVTSEKSVWPKIVPMLLEYGSQCSFEKFKVCSIWKPSVYLPSHRGRTILHWCLCGWHHKSKSNTQLTEVNGRSLVGWTSRIWVDYVYSDHSSQIHSVHAVHNHWTVWTNELVNWMNHYSYSTTVYRSDGLYAVTHYDVFSDLLSHSTGYRSTIIRNEDTGRGASLHKKSTKE